MNHIFPMVIIIYIKPQVKNFNVLIVAFVSIIGNDYRIHFWHMSKDNAINIINTNF